MQQSAIKAANHDKMKRGPVFATTCLNADLQSRVFDRWCQPSHQVVDQLVAEITRD